MSESFSPSYSVNKKHKMEADIMNEEQISQTLLDQMVSSDRGQMIKAAIPYLPPKGQQIFSVYEKAVEFINTVSVFSKRSSGSDLCGRPYLLLQKYHFQYLHCYCYNLNQE